VDTQTLWTSPKKGTLVTVYPCVRKPPNTHLCAILGQTGILLSGKNENAIQIQFIKEKIMWQWEHATYITAREPNCLWRITNLRPDANNHIMATVTPIKRNNSKTDNRTIPIKVAKNLITRHIEQMVVNTHKPSADFPTISEYFEPPSRNMNGNFIPENLSYNIPPRAHDADKSKTYLQIHPGHKITKNNGYVVLATAHKPKPPTGTLHVNHEHRGQPDRFVSNDEIIELLRYNRHNPKTNHQHENDAVSTDTISCPRYSNSTQQQYIRISRQAWNIFLKCYLCLRPKTDKTITIDFHDTWDALVQKQNNALRNRPGIGYQTNPKRPTGLDWHCIGKVQAPAAHIHTSIKLQQLIQSKTIEWAITDDWTDQHIKLSQPEWDKLEIRKIAYQSTIYTNGYFFQPGTRKRHANMLETRPHKKDITPKTKEDTGTDTSRQRQQALNPIVAANTWQQLNPTADPFASLPKDYYHTVTNTYATNITVGNQKSPGMESIFALQPPNWLHDVIITWWLGYWCAKTGDLSNFSITSQGKRNQNKLDSHRKTFFATPFFWTHVLDGERRRANETKYVDIFRCSRMLIPVNIKLKHWILACIDFEQKWIAWFDSISEAHEQETRLLFTWLTREHSFNRSTIFDPAEWSLHSGPPPGTQVPPQSNDYDCGTFICLYAAFLDIRLPLSFSQHDTRNVRAWMAHEMIEEGKLLKMIHSVLHDSLLATATGNSATSSDNSTAIGRTTTDTIDTTSTVTTTGDQKQSKRSSESQSQGDIKRQRTYEPETGEEEKNVRVAAEFYERRRAETRVDESAHQALVNAGGREIV